MRVLLDEQLDRRLKPLFSSTFEVATVHQQGWTGSRDGFLLRLAEAEFDALVSMDRGIPYQQNLHGLRLRIVIVRAHSNRLAVLAPLVPQICQVLHRLRPGELAHIAALPESVD